MSLEALAAAARARGLALRGAFHLGPADGAPPATGTLILLGPDEPRFWPLFAASPEAADGAPHPLDRWSKREIGALAATWQSEALFPSDGPPWPPFLHWAQRSGRAFLSPLGLLVHDTAGLLISYRGALALPQRLTLPEPPEAPCPSCEHQPCTTACPVGALRAGAPYDVAACQRHLHSDAGAECRDRGCLARRACPLSQNLHRQDAQAAFHMAAFVKNWSGKEGGQA
ncbi:ferredoxin [Salipiger abyssi]|uniref:ferredoxin n=1 Tax=Salipiger abyssi TaxID=1250539 RepID=UPI00405971CB